MNSDITNVQLHKQLLIDIQKAGEKHAIEKIILFGSRARGDANSRSDIDLAIIAPKIDREDWLAFYYKIQDLETLLEIDIVKMDEISEELKQQIEKEGQAIYERTTKS